ncbi:MAG TPA: glycerol-3-phosphate dehydrogenase/oxidase [Ktedonobacteraceae bacterium]|nr:glycerol-3-phosphate dehydrogenase/oxidase [Ktedonobacteraceae bacterium]
MDIARFAPEQRAQTLRSMAQQTFDVIVIGGGATGAGTALDASSRGLSVALLEARDLAGGTSSRSGKTLHGGLRYLKQFDFALVRQAAHERNLMVDRLCPHLTRPAPFLLPLVHQGWERVYLGSGVLLYDLLGGRRPPELPHHRHLTKRGALREMPALHAGRISGALQYYDVIFDDARHTLTLARTAAQYGALIATRTEVTGMLFDGKRVAGVKARDRETGEALEVRARCVINATGAWADLVQKLAGRPAAAVRPAKGVHFLVPGERIDSRTGLIAPTADNVLVVRPWGAYWIIGTTDTPWNYDRSRPVASAGDIDYLLAEVNKWLKTPLARDDILGVYAGVRPLLGGKSTDTVALRRDHAVLTGPEGLFTITGGKYTTYRIMAKDVMDTAARTLGSAVPPSVTAVTPLLGADGWHILQNQRERLAATTGLEPRQIDHLLGRYGSLVSEIFALLASRPALRRPIEGAPEYLEVEALYAASHEGALHLPDVLERRTHIAIETPDRGLIASRRVAQLMGEALGWDADRCQQEVERYAARVEADRRAEQAPDDAAAVATHQSLFAHFYHDNDNYA